jgi:N-methylhydantoinase B
MSTVLEPTPGQADAITYEVIRHRLLGITTEQAARLVTISGSKHVTEMSDYNVGLYLPDGSVAAMGRTILFHSACMAAMVRSVVADCEVNPGIGPGDMFIVNDPWKGSVHAPDMAIVAPLFVDGRLCLWAGAMMHMSDIGGMSEGSMVQNATEAYQEGMLLPPMKLVANGVVRQDVWNMILGNCRHASTMSLDLKGLMAANNAAMEGLEKLVRRYGADTLQTVMAGLIRSSETRLRKRLSELPDATIHASGFMEFDESLGDIPEVHCELIKSGDSLKFDFSQSSPQVKGATNCTRGGLLAGISAALLPTLAYDIPWNEGLYHAIDVICPEGLICNARKPAAVSGNISGAVWEVEVAATIALSRLVACSDTFAREAQASPCGRPGSLTFFGKNQHGEPFMGRTYDVLASGAAAYAHRDGVSTQGHHNIERTLVSNVEALELDLPMLYLRRGLAPDSGGAGRHRAGLSLLGVYKPHKMKSTFLRLGAQWRVPDAVGAFGGFPGARTGSELRRNSDVLAQFAGGHIPEFDELSGEPAPEGTTPQSAVLELGDVVRANPPAGAGWGDPLDRDTAAIEEDLVAGAISRTVATGIYGCIFNATGTIDAPATEKHREQLRTERTSWPRQKTAAPLTGTLTRICPIGDTLEVVRDTTGAYYTRCACNASLGPARENWREYAARRLVPANDIINTPPIHDLVEIREYACPACGRLHAADICRKSAPDDHDIQLTL